jgi:hypothetical protein
LGEKKEVICVLNNPQTSHSSTGLLGLGLLILEVSVSHTDTLLSVLLLSLDVSVSYTDTLLSVLLLSLDVSVSHTDTLLSVLLLSLDVSVSYTDTLLSVLLLSKSGRPLAETGTRQRIQYSQETHIFGSWRDTNLESQ